MAALAVLHAFGDHRAAFALAYAVVRFGHIALFVIASREDPARRSITGFGFSTTLLVVMMLAALRWR